MEQIQAAGRANFYAALENCSEDNAIPVAFAQLVGNGVGYIDRCVQISGLIYGRQLFSIPDQVYLSDRFSAFQVIHHDPNPFRLDGKLAS
ncbi:hypothetical protein HFP51_04680 [Parasphingopyxis sp. CP4]|uniref:hypothetical protein n=1 Tax=Parasphingopyxis sp. CP4 TaxID=2724527 RepID=UPI0015A02ED1|nr:hypothetical protein [Parasphingopyxis sp. CP4]QLC21534.1 hypothetical protein HFP51_04680 [Parasphingopyxis sp. CP4]